MLIHNYIMDLSNIIEDLFIEDRMDNIIEKGEMDEEECLPIFRYKFSKEIMDILYEFSKIHQYDDRKIFKESWISWIEIHEHIINIEIKRLKNNGCKKDILNKMFISSRYYFRKKSTAIQEQKKRCSYISVNKNLLTCMDNHILENIKLQNFKPSTGFTDFCINNTNIIKEQILLLSLQNINDLDFIHNKIKKTYKNRYFSTLSTFRKS